MLNKKDITIDGNGSLFLFHDRVFPFITQNCERVTFRDFSVDFSFPRCLEVTASGADENGFELLIDEKYGCSVNARGNLLIPAGAETFSSSERRFFLEQRSWHCFISVGDIYYENVNMPADVFFFEYAKDTLLERVRIIHGAGMGIVGQRCENMTLNEYVVSPFENDMYSTTADGILLTNFTGKVKMENCTIDRSIDDAISIHGFYVRVEKITDEKKILARLVHASQAGTCVFASGDLADISDSVTMNETGTIQVKDAFFREDPHILHMEFEERVEGKMKVGDYLGNGRRTPEIEIRGCVFNDFPAIRLSSSKKTVFVNNTVKNCNGVFLNDLMKYWSVTGCVNDVAIENNLFENVGRGVFAFVDRLADSTVMHKNVKICGNRFVRCNYGIVAEHVDGLIVKNNEFINTQTTVYTKDCKNTEIEK